MEIPHNYLPAQYKETGILPINHNYLPQQFEDYPEILDKIGKLVETCAFTLGTEVDDFERNICELTGAEHTIGVGSGTDALMLSLIAGGIQPGDEVITTPYTFFATIGAIVTAGAKPVFVDVDEDYNINAELIPDAITSKTKAILPVHWSGLPCDMDKIVHIADDNALFVVEDACHAICAKRNGTNAGRFGLAGCFSMHPLKNLNVWGDGGYIITDDSDFHDKLVLMRNHGLINRNECAQFTFNSRLDSIQAVVANHLLNKIEHITDSRIGNALRYDTLLSEIPEVKTPVRPSNTKQVHHLYCIRVKERDLLQKYLISQGIDAKVHYPIPMHLQPAAAKYGYKIGDFPICESICETVLSLPVHEFISPEDQAYVAHHIGEFYANR